MVEKYKQRFCVVCDDRPATWVIEQPPGDAEFTCGMHLSKRLTYLADRIERTAFRVTTIESYFVHFCLDCKRNVKEINELYMVWDAVWLEACPDLEGMLCVTCLERRIGRKLTPGDFTHCPLNTDFKSKSITLYRRLGHHIKHGSKYT